MWLITRFPLSCCWNKRKHCQGRMTQENWKLSLSLSHSVDLCYWVSHNLSEQHWPRGSCYRPLHWSASFWILCGANTSVNTPWQPQLAGCRPHVPLLPEPHKTLTTAGGERLQSLLMERLLNQLHVGSKWFVNSFHFIGGDIRDYGGLWLYIFFTVIIYFFFTGSLNVMGGRWMLGFLLAWTGHSGNTITNTAHVSSSFRVG